MSAMQYAKETLKRQFTSYWIFRVLELACRHSLFDKLAEKPQTAAEISQEMDWNPLLTSALLEALREDKNLRKEGNKYYLTPKGELLCEDNPDSLKQACILWGQEHWEAWTHLEYTLKTGKSFFEEEKGSNFFDYLQKYPSKNQNYHKAMESYAKDDYAQLAKKYNFGQYKRLADVGGGTGVLMSYLAQAFPKTQCYLMDKASVIEMRLEASYLPNLEVFGASFFEPLPFQADAIILSRVLHDWPDKEASEILKNLAQAMPKGGHLFIIENVQDRLATPLLTLNMQLICDSWERTKAEYDALAAQRGFSFVEQFQLGALQSVLKYQLD